MSKKDRDCAEFFKFVCECNEIYSPAQSKECPLCKKSSRFHKELVFDCDGFINRITELSSNENGIGSAIGLTMDAFWQLWDKYNIMTDILQKIDVNKLHTTILISILTCTFKYSKNLPEHIIFFKKVYDKMVANGESKKSVRATLKGLEGAGDFWKTMDALGATDLFWGPRPT